MGYLQNIKSPEMYVRMMRALMHNMTKAERNEACEEVRQHLEALVEDYQGQGHSPEDAMMLAVQQFGSPFRVGRDIAHKSEARKKRLLEARQPRLARQKKWLTYLSSWFGAVPVLLVMNCHLWPVILVVATAHAFLSRLLFQYTQRLEAGSIATEEPREERDWSESREIWKEKPPQIEERLRQKKSLWGWLNLRFMQWAGNRFLQKEQQSSGASSAAKGELAWQIFGLVYLAALVLWPAGYYAMTMKGMLIFLYVSIKASSLSRVLIDRLSPLAKNPQI